MSTRTAIGYAAAGVIVAASTVTATLATFGLGGGTEATATSPIATAGAEQALVTTPGGSTITLAPGEQLTSSEIVQTPAGPVEFLYVDAASGARGHDDDDDDGEHDDHEDRGRSSDRDDDDDEHENDDRRESRSSIRGERR